MKIAVYTANYGGVDAFRPPLFYNPSVDYVYFTDKEYESDRWQVMRDINVADTQLQSRKIKCLPHVFLPDADVTIYHDANLSLTEDPVKIVQMVKDADIGVFKHPVRRSIEQESECVVGKGVSRIASEKMIDSFVAAEFNPRAAGLYEASCIVRRNNRVVQDLNVMWWTLVANVCHRDQMSLPFAIWLSGAEVSILQGSRVQCDFLDYMSHIGDNQMAELDRLARGGKP